MLRIGVISDTHNLLRPEATSFLRGCDHILHAGDVCGSEVLDALRTIAPLTVVRGNNDRGEWAHGIAQTELGDAAQYPAIFEASRHTLQPGGIHLTDPDWIDTQPALTRDPGIARLASYLARPEIGLEPVVTTFREVFLGE